MVSSAHLLRSAPLLAGAILLLAGLFVGACDLVTGSSQGLGGGDSSVPANATLAYSPMPKGGSLPLPGEIPMRNGTVQAYRKSQKSPEGVSEKSDSSSAAESPYGCYLASRPYADAVRFRSVYLYFPESMVKEAGEETKRIFFSLEASSVKDSTYVAEDDLAEAAEQRERTGVRYANCMIPAASGAEAIANEQLIRAGEDSAAADAIRSAGQKEKSGAWRKNQICFMKTVWSCASLGSNCDVWKRNTYVQFVGAGGGIGDGNGGYPGGTGGGGGGEDGGDEGNGGDGSDPTDCSNFPRPGDWCEPSDPPDVNENKVCSGDPLKDMDIRPTCAGTGGGRFGENARQYPDGSDKPHWGIDLGGKDAEIGTEITPSRGGFVYANGNSATFGKYVIIRSGSTYFLYAHLSKSTVERTEYVGPKRKIGEMGKSGNARDADCNPVHLHLEVRVDDESWPADDKSKRKDPEEYIGTEFSDNGQPVSDRC